MIRGPAQRAKRETSHKVCAFVALTACVSCFAEPAAKPPLTVTDAIETTRFMTTPRALDPRSSGVVISPDGKRYVVMLIRGDVKRNGNRVEFLAGSVETFEKAYPAQFIAESREDGQMENVHGETVPAHQPQPAHFEQARHES